jgi:Tol biopolymer transport system component
LILSDDSLVQLTFDNEQIEGLAWTGDSREVIYSSNRQGTSSIWRIEIPSGSPELVKLAAQNNLFWPAVSLQGQNLAYESLSWHDYIWRIDLTDSTSPPVKIIWSSRGEYDPKYSPSGRKIAYSSFRAGYGDIWVCDGDGKNQNRITTINASDGSPNWSPDGQSIAFDSNQEGNTHIYIINASGGNPEKITLGESNNHIPSWSQDSQWIYFRSDRSGNEQIWRINVNGDIAQQITFNGGQSAYESFDEKWVYYTKGEEGIWKKLLKGGEEKLVINHPVMYGNWALVEEGIYYVYLMGDGYRVDFHSFKTGHDIKIAKIEGQRIWGICISPDRHWLLYTNEEPPESDIILMENFR